MAGDTRGGPEKRSDRTKAEILRAARELLAAHGYDRTTIRAVAAEAGIDPSMVMRYFVNKAQLFDAALDIDLRLPDLSAVPLDELPALIVRLFLDRWESNPTGDALLVLLRSAVTNDHAAAQMHQVFAEQVAPTLATALGHDLAQRRAGLVAAQLLGLGLTRYLLRLPAVAGLSREEIEHSLTPAIRATLELA
ncbi:DNA-binding transcriptional regulator, AcrR family [Nakamurella panacisegetis]|uniref:DNA-binding transcriptional regulator, AcrR family n=1 Tax=Nakamurella panacisegetis TaxID=1090615 RepID=A0A1H0PN46_9ACTN|nr:TetR family transcriptional regulator [Nakamurella panacisegetis]SDP06210.1 DNA-binding transcriptional regulator, AcrR family [Nakamurella panacisegetis]